MFSFFASLFTGIGGHYINRRWDRAVFFLSLFVLFLGIIWGLVLISYLRADAGIDVAIFIHEKVQLASLFSSLGIIVLWALSLLVTVLDTRFDVEENLVFWSKSGIGAAVFTTSLSCLIGVSSVVLFFI